jgi:asparagine N-glycosylation enzyme membrane subunit Stt3
MLSFSFHRLLSAKELEREKTKDYRNLVVLLVVIIVLCLLISEPLLTNPGSGASKLIISVLSFFGAWYAYLLWDLLRNFTSNRALLTTFLVVLAGIVGTGLLAEFPYYRALPIENRQAYLFVIHVLLFLIEVTVISFAIRDIFSGGYLTSDKLWGAACVFLLVGICFGSLYDLICIAAPGSLGIPLEPGVPNYAESVTFSFCILGGVESGLNPTRLVRNLSVIEGVWGSIYAMLIIGKLLGLPRLNDQQQQNKNP